MSASPAGTRMSARVLPPGTPMMDVVVVSTVPATSGPVGAELPATMVFTRVSFAEALMPPPTRPVLPLIVELVTVSDPVGPAKSRIAPPPCVAVLPLNVEFVTVAAPPFTIAPPPPLAALPLNVEFVTVRTPAPLL